MISRRGIRTARTALWIAGGWIAAALIVHWIVRRVPTHTARELTAAATGALIGLGSAVFELRLIPRHVRSLPMGGLLLVRTFFYVTLCALTLISFFINFVHQLNRMLGPGTLVNLLLGRYHRPVAEDRVFMFLDLNDSTAIAEKLGPLRNLAVVCPTTAGRFSQTDHRQTGPVLSRALRRVEGQSRWKGKIVFWTASTWRST